MTTEKKNKIGGIGLVIFLLLAAVYFSWAYWLQKAQAGADEFDPRRRPETAAATQPDREQFRQMRQQMDDTVARYTKAGPQERLTILDESIDRMEAMRAMWQARAEERPASATQPANGGQNWRANMPGRIANRLLNGDPQKGAARMEFMIDMRNRRAQRGLPPMGPH